MYCTTQDHIVQDRGTVPGKAIDSRKTVEC